MTTLSLPDPITAYFAADKPGSPVDLRYHFHLERGLIAALEISL